MAIVVAAAVGLASVFLIRRFRSTSVAAMLVVFVVVASAPAASAHATFQRAQPPDGGSVASSDEPVLLWLSESIALDFSSFIIRATDGSSFEPRAIEATLDGDDVAVTIRLPELVDGTYAINWRVLSEVDGHFSQGVYVFGVGASPDLAAVGADFDAVPVSVGETLLRWGLFLGLAAVIGALVFPRIILLPRLGGLLVRAAGAGAGAAFAAGAGLLVRQVVSLDAQPGTTRLDAAWQLVIDTRWGALWSVRQIALGVGALAIASLARRHIGNAPTVVAWGAVVAAAVAHSAASHAAGTDGASVVAIAVDVVHLATAAVWTGLVLVVAFVATPERTGVGRLGLLMTNASRFSTAAAVSAGSLVVTGIFLTGRHVASLEALSSTAYGRSLLVKLCVVGVLLVLGARHALRLHPRLRNALPAPIAARFDDPESARFATTVAAEAIVGAAVLALAALLTSTPTATGAEFEPAAAVAIDSMGAEVDDLVVTVRIKPNRPGDNIYVVHAASTRRPAPAPIDRVVLRFSRPGGDFDQESTTLDEIGDGRFQGGGDHLRVSGPWEVEAVLRRAGIPDVVVPLGWHVGDGSEPTEVGWRHRPLENALTAASVLLATSLLVAAAGAVATRGASHTAGRREASVVGDGSSLQEKSEGREHAPSTELIGSDRV